MGERSTSGCELSFAESNAMSVALYSSLPNFTWSMVDLFRIFTKSLTDLSSLAVVLPEVIDSEVLS